MELPDDMIGEVFKHLDNSQVRQVCKLWNHISIQIPRKIVWEILSHLNQMDHSQVRQVCTLWNKMSKVMIPPRKVELCCGYKDAAAEGRILDLMRTDLRNQVDMWIAEGCGGMSLCYAAAVEGACQGNQQEIIELLLKPKWGDSQLYLDYGLKGALDGNHQNLVDDLITRGAKR